MFGYEDELQYKIELLEKENLELKEILESGRFKGTEYLKVIVCGEDKISITTNSPKSVEDIIMTLTKVQKSSLKN